MPRKYNKDDVLVTLDSFSKVAGKTKESVDSLKNTDIPEIESSLDRLEYEINDGISAPLVIVVRAADSFKGCTITARSRVDGSEYTAVLEDGYVYIKVKTPGEYTITNSHDESVETAVVGEDLKKEVYFTDFYGSIDVTVDELLIGETIKAVNGETRVEKLAETNTTTLNVYKSGEWTVGIKGTEAIEKKTAQLSEIGDNQVIRLEVTEATPTITVTLADELKEEPVVLKKEEYSRTRAPKEGKVKFFIPEQGQWVVHLEVSEAIREQVNVNENKNFDVTIDLEDLQVPVLIVKSKAEDNGKTIKVSRGDVTLEKVLKDRQAVYILPTQGEWTISCDELPDVKKSVQCNENIVYRITYRASLFGIKVTQSESDTKKRIEPLEDLIGLKPISVNTQDGTVDYGDMEDTFLFQAMNNPVLLSINGQEEIELDPNDYSQKKDGGGIAPSANASGNYNLFSRIDKLYTYEYTSQGIEYYYISTEKVDENYSAVGFTREDNSECDHTYVSTYLGYYDGSSRLRSISSVNIRGFVGNPDGPNAARRNGTGYFVEQHQQINLIQIAYLMLVQDFNSQAAIGRGRDISGADNSTYQSTQTTGFANQKGPIAYDKSSQAIKFMHIEDLWFNGAVSWLEGIAYNNYVTYIRMKPPYITSESSGTSTYTQVVGAATGAGQIKASTADNKYGRIPSAVGGSSTTYECDEWNAGGSMGFWACIRGARGLFARTGTPFTSNGDSFFVTRLTYLPPAK